MDETHTKRAPKPTHFKYGWIVYAPLLAAIFWTVDLVGLLALWAADGYPDWMHRGRVVYISDCGAYKKVYFIIFNCLTAAFYILSLFAERWYRHVDRIPGTVRSRERNFDIAAIIFGVIGSAGLITLGICDDKNYATVHWSMTVVFVVGVALSAICQTVEIWTLSQDHPNRAHLRRNGIVKLIVVGFAVACAITFGGLQGTCKGDRTPNTPSKNCYNITSAAASFEWGTAFLVVFYFLTLGLDLWPVAKTSPRFLRKMAKWEEDHLSKAESHLIADLHDGPPANHYYSTPDGHVGYNDPESEAYQMRQQQPQHPYAAYV